MKYEIVGEPYPAVVCHLQQGEKMRTESGSMVWMDPVMQMETSGGGGIGKVFGRMISGENMFQNIYTAQRDGIIAFGSSFPGQILPIEIKPGQDFIAQKSAFLASEIGVDLSVHFNQKLGGGFFGGEGFIMQRLSGQGMAFIECDGSLVRYELAPGQSMVVDTGNVLGFTSGVDLRVDRIKGAKNIVFGGEGLFNTVLTGPGTIYLQTMPVSSLIDLVAAHIPSKG
ncbi:MAG: TIGR00266 family protein [Atopobiaceae bacterium]|nr:TIGR00266 family protein [Atopobiaceae bacterium]